MTEIVSAAFGFPVAAVAQLPRNSVPPPLRSHQSWSFCQLCSCSDSAQLPLSPDSVRLMTRQIMKFLRCLIFVGFLPRLAVIQLASRVSRQAGAGRQSGRQSSGRMNGLPWRIKYLCLCQFELASMMQFDSEQGQRNELLEQCSY